MNMNKLVAFVVLALFVASILPFVAAGQARQGQGGNEDAVVAAGQPGARPSAFEKSREEMRTRAQKEPQQKREEVRTAQRERKESLRAVYEEAKLRREERKELHKQFKEQRQQIKADRETARAEIGQTREQVRNCVGKSDEACMQARIRAKVAAGKFLTKSAEHIIALIEKAKERVETSALSDEEKAKQVAALDAVLADADAAQQAVASLGENATKEDLKEGAQMIRDVWAKARKEIKKCVGVAASSRIGGILVKMEKLSTKFDRVIEKLQARGKDTSSAEAKKAEFQAKLDSAKALQNEAKALFESGNHDAAAQKIQAAHAELKTANELLRGIVQEIRGIGGEKELEETPAESNEQPVPAAA